MPIAALLLHRRTTATSEECMSQARGTMRSWNSRLQTTPPASSVVFESIYAGCCCEFALSVQSAVRRWGGMSYINRRRACVLQGRYRLAVLVCFKCS